MRSSGTGAGPPGPVRPPAGRRPVDPRPVARLPVDPLPVEPLPDPLPGGPGDAPPVDLRSPLPASVSPAPGSPYWRFYDVVAARQLAEWLPERPGRLLDVSGGSAPPAPLLDAGHRVVRGCLDRPLPAEGRARAGTRAEGLVDVRADCRSLGWVRDASVEAVLAESRALSRCLAAEVTAVELARVLRPGGRLLLVVDSLHAGLARLAEQQLWAELADVPRADVVLVPGGTPDAITRCFAPDELAGLLAAAGLDVEWVRPRTVLGPGAVERALREGAAVGHLADAEMRLARGRDRDGDGLHLVASARRPG